MNVSYLKKVSDKNHDFIACVEDILGTFLELKSPYREAKYDGHRARVIHAAQHYYAALTLTVKEDGLPTAEDMFRAWGVQIEYPENFLARSAEGLREALRVYQCAALPLGEMDEPRLATERFRDMVLKMKDRHAA